mmetsp:Transcript_21197/g.55263  ORF Transcript_21197/g.55263 Transcript_21197/m.55263 type:complete len:1185 (-) Transcript_21197:87-3641(-)
MERDMTSTGSNEHHDPHNVTDMALCTEHESAPRERAPAAAFSIEGIHQLYSKGQIGRAEEELERMLDRTPNHVAALLLLGAIDFGRDNTAGAVDLCTRAAANARPNEPLIAQYAAHYLQMALQQRTDNRKAAAAFECTLALNPANAPAWCDYGNLFREQGRVADSVRCIRKALELNPRLAVAWNNLGCSALDQNDVEQASAHFVKALLEDPTLEVAYSNLLGLRDPASGAVVLYQLSCQLVHGGRLDDAIIVLNRCLRLNPMNASARSALGSILHRQGRLVEARTFYEESIRLAPTQSAECHINLGHLLRDLGDLASARVSFLNGIQLTGGNADDYNHLACICKDLGQCTEAIAYYRLSLGCKADNPNVYSNLLHSLMMICDWRRVEKGMPRVVDSVLDQIAKGEFPSIHPHHTFLYSLPNTARKEIAAAHARVAINNAAALRRAPYTFDHLRAEIGARVRVGYVSSDFCDHPTAHLMQSVPEFHDRSRFEVFCYALSSDDRSTYRARISAGAEHFVDLSTVAGALARADRIYADRIHVLIDLNGYTRGANSEIFALKPAPMQAMWLGYPGTSGAPYMDYFISDAITSPPELWEESYSEKLVYLPHTFFVGDHKQAYPLKVKRLASPCRTAAGAFVPAGAVNPIARVHPSFPRLPPAWCGGTPRTPAPPPRPQAMSIEGEEHSEASAWRHEGFSVGSAAPAKAAAGSVTHTAESSVTAIESPISAATVVTTTSREAPRQNAASYQPCTVPFVQTNYIRGASFDAGFLTDAVYERADTFLFPHQGGLASPAMSAGPQPVGMMHPSGDQYLFAPWMGSPVTTPAMTLPMPVHLGPVLPAMVAPQSHIMGTTMAGTVDGGSAEAAPAPDAMRSAGELGGGLGCCPGLVVHMSDGPSACGDTFHTMAPYSFVGRPYAPACPAAIPQVPGFYSATPVLQQSAPTPIATVQIAACGVHVLEPEHCPTVGPFTKKTPQPPVTRMYYGLPDDAVVFCNFNQLYKLDSELFACWMRVLKRAPKSVLWLLRFPPAGEANVLVAAQAAGIEPHRVIFSDLADKTEHIRRGSLADMCLDTLRCNGHTTGMDILWGGTPLLTVPGDTLAARVSSSLVVALGHPQLVCDDLDEYEDKAVHFATNRRELRELQQAVRDARVTSPLFDTKLRTRHLETGYRAMVDRFMDGLEPDHIELDE